MSISGSRIPLVFALVSCLAGAGCLAVGDNSEHMTPDELCRPTGRSLVDTGVYLSPEGCTNVTLYALEAQPENDSWILAVGWPMYGEYHALELTNQATGDFLRKIIYSGDPEFTLFAGNYLLGGFEMAQGDNPIDFVSYDTLENPDGTLTDVIDREGTYTIHVTLSDSIGN
jgi:hypothetical protein